MYTYGEVLTVYIVGTNPCMRDEYNCFDGSQCIPMEKFCNGVRDCFLIVGTNPCMREGVQLF